MQVTRQYPTKEEKLDPQKNRLCWVHPRHTVNTHGCHDPWPDKQTDDFHNKNDQVIYIMYKYVIRGPESTLKVSYEVTIMEKGLSDTMGRSLSAF